MTPLQYFWIIEYSDGTALPQFDPDTGIENKIDFDRDDIVRISWNPVTYEMKIADDKIIRDVGLDTRRIIVDIEESETPIIYRENHLSFTGSMAGLQRVKYIIGKRRGDQEFKIRIDDNEIVVV